MCTCISPEEPEGVAIHSIHGFVEELVVNDDPEYQVSPVIKTSNEELL